MFARILGLLFLAAVAAAVILAGVLLVLVRDFRRTGRLRWPRFSAVACGLLYSPLCKWFRLFGKPTQVLDLFLIDAANAAMARRFAAAGPSRLLVGPQCLRAGGCEARLDPAEGYQCTRCGRCAFADLSRLAEELGFKLFIVPGDRFAKRLAERYAADAAIGIACPAELSMALLAGMKMGVASAGVALARDGCFETEVDLELVEETMRRCGHSSK
ncbi:DUF116 domain-containing protein [bacterium]|nr:DUF116 domain-containing protein [bacterium]